MDGFQTVQTDDPVKFRQNIIEMIYNIITAVPDVTGIEADAHFFL